MAAIRSLILVAGMASGFAPVASTHGQTPIPSRIVKVVEFEDRGRLYRVDLETGRVEYQGGDNTPIEPDPPAPKPPKPEPPKLDGLALEARMAFLAAVKADQKATAEKLTLAMDVAISMAGGLGLKGQEIIAELIRQIDHQQIRAALAGFKLGDILSKATGGDDAKIIPAMRDVKRGIESIGNWRATGE